MARRLIWSQENHLESTQEKKFSKRLCIREESDTDYLQDMLGEIDNLRNFVANISFHEFMSDLMRRNAAIRSFEVIGEASKKIPEEMKNTHPGVPWKQMTGMRDKLIHGYFGVDYESVWTAVIERVPQIKPHIEEMLKSCLSNDDGSKSEVEIQTGE